MCNLSPPFTLVTMLVGVPGLAAFPLAALAEVPPQGPSFCGSPRLFSSIQDAGSNSLKCAQANGAIAAVAARARDKLKKGLIAASPSRRYNTDAPCDRISPCAHAYSPLP